MKTKGIRLTKDVLDAALAGGTILGGGGGGDPKKGRKYAEIAVDYTDLRLITIDDLDEDDVLLTASLVGAPNAANQYMTPKDIAKTVEILQKNCDFHIGGIITNEQGGEATVNGWLQAAVTGLPVVDAPCNGRAHPTGVMGSMNLHKIPIIPPFRHVSAAIRIPEIILNVSLKEISIILLKWCVLHLSKLVVWLR